jgi:hypothetical protein
MSDLTTIALGAILTLARPPAVDPVAERPRLEDLAKTVAHVVDERDALATWLPGSVAPLPFRGPWARQATALALVAIAWHESGFAADVADCRRLGAFEPSISAFQLHGPWAWGPYTKAQICRSPRRAAERALFVLAHHGVRCRTPARWFSGYASGNCGRDVAAGRRQCAIWERLARGAGLDASCGRAVVTGREPRG